MNFSLVYILNRFFFRLGDFFHHWYVDGARYLFHYFFVSLEKIDRRLAFRVTLAHIFEPLYKDYTIIGHIVGFIFRFVRVLIGLVFYAGFAAIFLAVYLFWLILPFAIFAYAAKPFLK